MCFGILPEKKIRIFKRKGGFEQQQWQNLNYAMSGLKPLPIEKCSTYVSIQVWPQQQQQKNEEKHEK